jgi:hypothetical protein
MTQFIGRLRRVGIAKENVKGTGVVPAYWLPLTAADLNPVVETKLKEGAIGRIEDAYDSDVVSKHNSPALEGYLTDKAVGLLLLAALGQVSSALKGGESAVYEHTYIIKNDNDHPALTLSFADPVYGKWLQYAMLNKLDIEAKVNDYVQFKSEFLSKLEATKTGLTPAASNENAFVPRHITVKIADNVAGLGAASAVALQSIRLGFGKNAEAVYTFGSNEPNTIVNKEFALEGDLEAVVADATWRDLYLGNTTKAMQIAITSDVTIGSASNPSIVITLNSVKFTTYKDGAGNKDLIKEQVGFKVLYNVSDAKAIGVILTNDVASY